MRGERACDVCIFLKDPTAPCKQIPEKGRSKFAAVQDVGNFDGCDDAKVGSVKGSVNIRESQIEVVEYIIRSHRSKY